MPDRTSIITIGIIKIKIELDLIKRLVSIGSRTVYLQTYYVTD